MTSAKIAISIDAHLLRRVDSLVKAKHFQSRSEAFQAAVTEQLDRFDRHRLARECAKLDPEEERAFADAGLSTEQWPPY